MLYFAGTDEYLDTGWDRDPIVFNLSGGCRQTHRQRHLRGAIDVFFNLDGGPCRTRWQGRHRHLQHRWWTLSDPPVAPPRGPTIDVFFNLGGGRCRQCPQGARHRRHLQHRWWTLPDPLIVPPRGPPSTPSSTSVVDAVGPTDSAPQESRHRRLLLPR
jgi:hypothetical protein